MSNCFFHAHSAEPSLLCLQASPVSEGRGRANRLYRQDNRLDLSKLEKALVKFVFPLKIGDQWPLTENRTKMPPVGAKPGMTPEVVKTRSVDVLAGHFDGCYFLQEEWVDARFEDWFCPNVGIVDSKADHRGALEGWHEVLVRHDLNR